MRFIVIALLLLLSAPMAFLHAGSKDSETSGLLDINAATAAVLAEKLPGIGPAKAALIVQWREQNGRFTHIDQLQEVKGIGPRTIEKLRSYIRVGSEAAAKRTRLQHEDQETRIRTNVHRLISAANEAARPESIEALPRRAWYRKSILEILRTH